MSGFDFSLFSKGGPMMLVIVFMAAVAIVLFIERALYLHRGQIKSKAFLDGIKNTLNNRRLVEAATICEETPGPVASIVKAALMHAGKPPEKLRYAVQEAAIVEIPSLERRLGAFAAIGQVAPLVGLLGTLFGMIMTFHAFMQGAEFATATALSNGLWQALTVTAASLLLAIPVHLGHHFLRGRVRALTRDMEWAANEIMEYLINEYEGEGIDGGAPAPKGKTAKGKE
ncbi:MotA/TolQ/ExbB proton channel family protein [Ereboglobus luteus]|uniref:Flagellar motor protein MotA n=1 Tax=Ereboglobus luteus TaxID=1796921 RepID=A0A2U8E0P9_9BACT|nr:MotA/TolQ/ExbB proton channel family protein [Ereboglobus luteus]AWI08418.1 flagellar motor protein MotA [Ereboglobus luteus]